MSNTYINLTFESKIDWVKKINEYQEEIKILKEEYVILQNASAEVEEEKDREIERLNNIINELEQWLEEYEKGTYSYGGINDLMQIPIHRIRYKIKELKGSDKE